MIAFALSTAVLCSALAADEPPGVADGGTPAPATLPASFTLGPIELTPQLDLFGSFEGVFPTEAKSDDRFAVPRALAGLEVQADGVRGRFLVEGVYSTEGGALIGTAGDSEVIRLREAWGGYRWRFLEARLGVIPDPQFAPLEHAWAFRQLAPDGLEAFHLSSPADFGASVRGWLPAELGWVAIAVSNGEGYGQRELNTGKNLTLAANVRPVPGLKPLEVVASGVLGSAGVGNTRADRLGGGVLWDGGWLGAGVTAHAFWGLADDGGRRGLLLQAFARAQLFERLLLAVRGEHLWRDFSATADDSVSTLAAGLGVRLGFGCELFAEYERDALSPLARASQPGADVNVVRVVVRLNPFLSQLEDWR
ncbi:MAG: hypothetical protein QM723_08105 [Myxococcaceae bacterium]